MKNYFYKILFTLAILFFNLISYGQPPCDASFTGLISPVCGNAPTQTLTPANLNATFSGPGMSGNVFDPLVAGAGTHTITCNVGTLPTGYNVISIPFVTPPSISNFVTLADDELSATLPIGFTFNFYGINYTNFEISSNGFILFDLATFQSGCCSGQFLPDANPPNNLIAAAWEDLYPPAGGQVGYQTFGTAPNRTLVVSWNGISNLQTQPSPDLTTSIILYETSNVIEIHTTSLINGLTNIYTQGIENATGTIGTTMPGRNAAGFDLTNDGVRFIPVVPCTPNSSTQTITVLPFPTITVTTNPSVTCAGGTAVLNATGTGSNYMWMPGSLVGASQTVTVNTTTTYTVASSLGNCNNQETITVVANPISPQPTGTANPPTLCQNDSSTLSVVTIPAATVDWWDAPTGGNLLSSSLAPGNFTVAPATTTTYYVEVSQNIPTGSQVFNFTGSVQNFTVPAGVTSLTINARGAKGIGLDGFDAGLGGGVTGTISVIPGQTLFINVADSNGFNGGGAGQGGANGGGASDVRIGGNALNNRVIVAGGGGGAGGDNWICLVGTGNGGGGTPVGANFVGGAGGAGYSSGTGCGIDGGAFGGAGGTGVHGGGGGGGGLNSGGVGAQSGVPGIAQDGVLGFGGASFNSPSCFGGTGGGGGGYYGGGGAAGNNCGAGRGGGGSSWIVPTASSISFQGGIQNGNGQVTISWTGGVYCVSTPRVPVTVTVGGTPPTISVTPNAVNICNPTNSTFTASGSNGTYTWNPGSLFGSSITVNPPVSTIYTVTGTDIGGCSNTATASVNISPGANIQINPAYEEHCVGGYSVLNATGGVSYTWMPGSIPGSSVVLTPTTSTIYTVTGTDAFGCTGTSISTVVVTNTNGDVSNSSANNAFSLPGLECESIDHLDGMTLSYFGPFCKIISTIADQNSGNILGNTNACATVDGAIPLINGQAFCKRWFEISPSSNGSTSLSLYLTLADFTDYNSSPLTVGYPQLPNTGSNSDPNITNIIVTRIDGTTFTDIIPNTTWEAANNRYKLTFQTPTLSQFRIGSRKPTNLSEIVVNGTIIKIYPNPASDVMHVSLNTLNNSEISVYLKDMSGRTIKTISAKTVAGFNTIDLNVSDIANGLYSVQLFENGKNIASTKINKF